MKKILSVMLSVVLLFAFIPVVHAQITKDQYYARSTLSESEQKYYDAVYEDLLNHNFIAKKDYGKYGISLDRANQIEQFIWNDSPELYNFYEHYSPQEEKELNAQLQNVSAVILSKINDDMTDYEKVKAIYVYLGKNIEYDNDAAEEVDNGIIDTKLASDSQTIIGGIINKKAVCVGIAHSLQYLLYKIDIPCYSVSGTYLGESHRWNLIKVDGEWYYADLTMNLDIIKNDGSLYFLKDDSFLMAFKPDEFNPKLPACTSSKYMIANATPEPAPITAPTIAPVVASAEPTPVIIQEPEAIAPEEGKQQPVLWIVAAGAVAVILLLLVRRKKKS